MWSGPTAAHFTTAEPGCDSCDSWQQLQLSVLRSCVPRRYRAAPPGHTFLLHSHTGIISLTPHRAHLTKPSNTSRHQFCLQHPPTSTPILVVLGWPAYAHTHNHQLCLCHLVEMWKWGLFTVLSYSAVAELWSCGPRSQLCIGISFSPGRPVATASGWVRQLSIEKTELTGDLAGHCSTVQVYSTLLQCCSVQSTAQHQVCGGPTADNRFCHHTLETPQPGSAPLHPHCSIATLQGDRKIICYC